MSTRAALREWLGHEAPDRTRMCAVCGGGEWSALWVGATELHVCAACALEVLPRLIADAIWHQSLTPADVETIVGKVRGEFWRAVAINALRACKGTPHREA